MLWQTPDDANPPGPSVIADGIMAGTPIATPQGWSPVEALRPGDPVITFDSGLRRITDVFHARMTADLPRLLWPIRVPAGALDCRTDLLLAPEQKLLVESDAAEELYGNPFALLPAMALEGWRGIHRARPEPATIVQLRFSRDQFLYASRAVLLACPGDSLDLTSGLAGLASPPKADYCALTLSQARHLVACLMAEDFGAALHPPMQPPGQAAFAGAKRP